MSRKRKETPEHGQRTSAKFGVRRRRFLTLGLGAALGGGALSYPFIAFAKAVTPVTLYRDPQCSCCEGYADYLRANDFAVTVIGTHDLPLMNEKYGVPDELQGCHLSKVGGYFVGGHVPVEIVRRLLAEKPAIKGITLPGMPMGSPGMSGSKTAPFQIYAIGNGPPKLYATV